MSRASLILTALALTTLSFTLSILAPQFLSGWPSADLFVDFNPLFHLPTFCIGVALGCHFLRRKGEGVPKMLALAGLMSVVALIPLAGRWPPLIAHNSLFIVPFACVIYGLGVGGWGSRILALPVLVALGEASYSLYILQFPMGLAFRRLNEHAGSPDLIATPPAAGTLTGASGAAACLVLMIVTSLLVYRYFESPMRRFVLDRFRSFRFGPRREDRLATEGLG